MFQSETLQYLGPVFQGWWACLGCGALHVGSKVNGWRDHGHGSRRYSALIEHESVVPENALGVTYGWIPRPESCSCGAALDEHRHKRNDFWPWVYVEIDLDIPGRVSGHCDGILDWTAWDGDGDPPGSGVEVLELKTASEWSFKNVDASQFKDPYPSHVLQTTVYRVATGCTAARIVYINKQAAKFDASLSEHVVDDDPSGAWNRIVEYHDAMLRQWTDPDPGPVPPRLRECKSKSTDRAKQCPCSRACFSADLT